MKISWQLEILYFCQLYTWLWFCLLMETTCKILITGWQLGTEEVMALLKAGSRFHQCFVDCPAYSFMWGDDSAQDCGAVPGLSLEPDHLPVRVQSRSEWTMWDLTLPWCFHVGAVLPVGDTGWQMTWLGACQYKVKLVAEGKLELPEEIFTVSWFFVTFLICSSRFFKLDSQYQQTTASALIPIFFRARSFFLYYPDLFADLMWNLAPQMLHSAQWGADNSHQRWGNVWNGILEADRQTKASTLPLLLEDVGHGPQSQDLLVFFFRWPQKCFTCCWLVLSLKYGLSFFFFFFCLFLLVLQNSSTFLLIFLTVHD